MKKALLLVCGLLLGMGAHALELAGVKLPDTAQVGSVNLKLNGAGIRTKLFFKIYVGALYLPQKQASAEAIIDDDVERRIVLHMLREVESDKLYGAFREAVEANHTQDVLSAIDVQMQQMAQIFKSMEVAKKGDVIMLDYQPASGTRISVNGTERGTIAGAGFNRALLRIWLGGKPVQEDLKKGMLGG